MNGIVSQILTRTYIHAAIYLPAVSTNDFSALGRDTRQMGTQAIDPGCKSGSKTRLTTRRRSQYGYHRIFHAAKLNEIIEKTK